MVGAKDSALYVQYNMGWILLVDPISSPYPVRPFGSLSRLHVFKMFFSFSSFFSFFF